jgi:SAM-dependent methyltransferase
MCERAALRRIQRVQGSYALSQTKAGDSERERLRYVEHFHDPGTIRCLESVGVSSGWRCLDVGAGAGSVARWLLGRVGPQGEVVALDLETALLDPLVADGLLVRRGDVTLGLPDDGGYDLVHSRLLLIHLVSRQRVVNSLLAAARPGGIVMLGDVDLTVFHALDPGPGWTAVWDSFLIAVEHAGWDVACGARLCAMLASAGAEDVHAEGSGGALRGGSVPCELLARTVERLRERLLAMDVPPADLDASIAELRSPAHRFVVPNVWTAWGRRAAESAG